MSYEDQNKIVLRLNTDVVASLFPEGSQARVDLQQAVIAKVIERVVTKEIRHIDWNLEAQVKNVIAVKLQEMGVTSKWAGSSSTALSPELTNRLRNRAEEEVNLRINEGIRLAVNQAVASLQPRIDKLLEGELTDAIRDLARKALKDVLK